MPIERTDHQEYEVFIPFPERVSASHDLQKEIAEQLVYLSPNITAFSFDTEGIELRLSTPPSDPDVLKEMVHTLVSDTATTLGRVKSRTLYENAGHPQCVDDPYKQLVDSRQALPLMPGVFGFQGDFLRVMRRLDALLLTYALELGAVEQSYPTTLSTRTMAEVGYLSGFPQNVLFAAPVRHSMDSIDFVANKPEKFHQDLLTLREYLGPHSQMLAPTVCHHCFESLRGSAIPSEGALFTAVGMCHRHESSNFQSLKRLQTYTMREQIFYGSSQRVEQRRQQFLEHAFAKMQEWGVRCRIVTASDPFFATATQKKRAYQTVMGLKYELLVHLPYSNEWLAVASFNNHEDNLVSKFHIKHAVEEPLFSGCVAYGYERLTYALFSQFGTSISDWPDALKRFSH
jgi:seryl-tRNA synthetase